MLYKNMYDRILGAFYGQAVGNAMGMPVTNWSQEKVWEHFGWIDDFLHAPDANMSVAGFRRGQVTGDTLQAIILMQAIIANDGEVNEEEFLYRLLNWAEEENAFEIHSRLLDPTSKLALQIMRESGVITFRNTHGITNVSAMRISPLGCLLPTSHQALFINNVYKACSPTHQSDIAVSGATVIAWCISRAIEGASWDTICQEILPLAHQVQKQFVSTFSTSLTYRLEEALDLSMKLRNEDIDYVLRTLYQKIGAGMTITESVPMALALVNIANTDPMGTAVLAANLGGDADTIGAMATAIAGAIHGASAFSEDTIDLIESVNYIDFTLYARKFTQYRLQYIERIEKRAA